MWAFNIYQFLNLHTYLTNFPWRTCLISEDLNTLYMNLHCTVWMNEKLLHWEWKYYVGYPPITVSLRTFAMEFHCIGVKKISTFSHRLHIIMYASAIPTIITCVSKQQLCKKKTDVSCEFFNIFARFFFAWNVHNTKNMSHVHLVIEKKKYKIE